MFWELLEEFKQAKVNAKQLVLSQKHKDFAVQSSVRRYSGNPNNEETRIPPPHRIIVFRMPPSRSCWYAYLDEHHNLNYSSFEASEPETMEGINREFGTLSEEWEELDEQAAMQRYGEVYLEDRPSPGIVVSTTAF